jgi:hypothetical protein
MTGISSEHLFCSSCWEGNTEATHFGLKFLLHKDCCRTKLVFLCPILELRLTGLESVDVVLVDVDYAIQQLIYVGGLPGKHSYNFC